MKKRLVVLGGGIKGAATSAVASLLEEFQVTLVELNRIGAGATATNNGRLHLGTMGWEKEKDRPDLVRRRLLASELVRDLPNVLISKRDALYCFEEEADAVDFRRFSTDNGIPYQLTDDIGTSHGWIDLAKYQTIIQVPEHSFNPAQLAGRLAQTCRNAGGSVLVGHSVIEVERQADRLIVRLGNGEELVADVVVNTMSRWCMSLGLPPEAPRPNIGWSRWQLLCLRSAALANCERLEQVVVIVDRERKMPSVIPHDDWVTLDYNATPVTHPLSPDGDDAQDWREFDGADATDAINFAAVSRVFNPVAQLSPDVRNGKLFSLAGMQGRLVNARPGSQNRLQASELFTGYFVAFGGQASTGLLDAIEICGCLRSRSSMPPVSRLQIARHLNSSLAASPIPESVPMRWQQHNPT